MKIKTTIAITVLAIVLGVAMVFDMNGAERRLCDAGVYDMLTPELIEAYEREIAGESVVSDKTQSQLTRSAGKLGIEVSKLKAIMLLQDLAGKAGRDISLAELAGMNEIKLLSYFKQCAEIYLAAQPEDRQNELKQMFTELVKIPVRF